MRGEEARVRDAFCSGEGEEEDGEGGGVERVGGTLAVLGAVGGVGGALERGQGVWRVCPWLWLCRVGMLVPVGLQRPPRALL